MNLELKEEFKKGGFGKVVAGAGTENRAEIKGNYNKFNEKIQFSIVGVANNTGRNGLSWNDYRDFMGSQSFVYDDGGDYGFGGGGRFISFGGGGNGIESNIQSIFFSGDGGGGFPESYNGGLNFNYDHEKNKVSAVYYYNHAGLNQNQEVFEQQFFSDYTLDKVTDQQLEDVSDGHRAELNFTHEFDSLHTLKLFFNGAYIDQTDLRKNNITQHEITELEDTLLINQSSYNNTTDRKGYLGKSMVLFNKKFKKKGRRFGVNTTFLTTELNDEITQQSTTDRYNKMGDIEFTNVIDRFNTNDATKVQWKTNAVYVEPLSKKFFSQIFYNFSSRKETGVRLVNDVDEDGIYKTNQTLSRDYENRIDQNRVGSSIRYSHDGVNISVGLAYQVFNLSGLYNIGSTGGIPQTPIEKKYPNFIPYLGIDVSPSRNLYFDASYNRYASEPAIEDLKPIIDDENPFYIKEGNPDLLPEISNDIRAGFSKSWPVQAIRIRVGADYSFYENQFSTNETVTKGVTSFKPINLDGGKSASANAYVSFPIIKNKFTVRTNARYRNSNRQAIINDITNQTKTNTISGSCRISITPNPNIGLYINGNTRFSDTQYDIEDIQVQQIKNHNFNVEFNTKTVWGIFLNSDFEYAIYKNDRYDFNEDIPTLNVSVYKQFLKKKKMEARVSLYDAFNQNTAISQNAYNNLVRRSQTEAIGRYLMFSITYNIQGLKDGVQKSGWW